MGTRLTTAHAAAVLLAGAMLFVAGRSAAAQATAATATVAVRLATPDTDPWRVIGASRYVAGDVMGALDAWNRTGEPRVDTIHVSGAGRTRRAVVVRTAGLQPGEVLTRETLGRALRRLRDLPVASTAQIRYEATVDGRAKVDVLVEERDVVPRGWIALATLGARAAMFREVRLDVAGPTGAGERLSAAWRWTAERPRVSLGVAFPTARWFRGIVLVDGSWDRQAYNATPSSAESTVVREERRRVGLALSDWSSSWLRWRAGAAVDRLRAYPDAGHGAPGTRVYLSMDGTTDARLARDRLAVTASAGWWAPFAGGEPFGRAGLQAVWRSTDDTARASWAVSSGIVAASRAAPLALWPGAGTGHGRGGLLRAHPLHQSGVLTGPVFGRHVAQGTVEHLRPVFRLKTRTVSVAAFVDAARAWERLNGLGTSPLYVDAGVGVRVMAPDFGGAVRADVTHGLRGGGTRFSASWSGSWPQ